MSQINIQTPPNLTFNVAQSTNISHNELQKWALRLLALSINIEFLRNFLNGYLTNGIEYAGGIQLLAVTCALLSGFLFAISGQWRCLQRHNKFWIVTLLCYTTTLAFRGGSAIDISQVSLLKLLLEWSPFLLFVTIFCGMHQDCWQYLEKTFVIHTIFGVGIFFWGTAHLTAVSRFAFWENGTITGLWSLYASPFLFLNWNNQSKIANFIGLIGFLALLIGGILTETRTYILNRGLVWLTLAIWIWFRNNKSNRLKLFVPTQFIFLLYITVSLVIFYSLLVMIFNFNNIGFIQAQKFWDRLTNETTIADESRFREATLVIEQMNYNDWLIGRAFGSSWDGGILYLGAKRNVVHFGYLHLVFKGGVPLLALILLGPLATGFRTIFSSRNTIQLVTASVLVQYSFELITLGAPEAKLWFLLICLSMGTCLIPYQQSVSSA